MAHTRGRPLAKDSRRWWPWFKRSHMTRPLSAMGESTPVVALDAEGVSREIELGPAREFLRDLREEQHRADMAATLVRGLAHGLNNHLHVIGAQVKMISNASADAKVQASVSAIRASCEAIQRTFEALSASTTQRPKDAPVFTSLNLAQCLEEWRPMLGWLLPETHDIQIVAAGDVWVRADHDLLFYALFELVKNAAESMGKAPAEIRIACGRTRLEARDLGTVHPLCNARVGNFGFIEVEDEGEGIDVAHLAHVFDPFYSTRFLGRGLGLAAVLMKMRRMQGVVSLDSTRAVGTRARLLLPEEPAHGKPD